MRKSWVLAVAIVLTTGLSAAGRPPEPARQRDGSYVIASAEEREVVQARVPVTTRSDVRQGSPGSWSLFFVGSLLMGLGAAVRRST